MKVARVIGKQTALQASIALAAMSVISKALGLGREMLVARNLGASSEYDLYLTVAMLPTAVMSALMYTVGKTVTPYYQRARVQYGDKTASVYGWQITLAGCAALGLLAALGAIFAEAIVVRLLPQAGHAELQSGIRMFRIVCWYPVLCFWFTSIGAFLRAERFFVASSLGLVAQNICVILGLLLFADKGAWALVAGWILALVGQGILVTGIHLRTGHPLQVRTPESERFPKDYAVGLLFAGMQIVFIEIWGQLWTIADRSIAQYVAMPEGTIASLTLANSLFILPLSMFNLGIGRVFFPLMAEHVAAGDHDKAQHITIQGLRAVAVALIPMAFFVAIQSKDVVGALYLRGAFDADALQSTSAALGIAILALPLAGCYVIQGGLMFAQRQYRILVQAAIAGGFVKLVASYALAGPLGIQGLAGATCLAHLTRILVIQARTKDLPWSRAGVLFLVKIVAAAGLAAMVTWVVLHFAPVSIRAFAPGTWLHHLLRVAIGAPIFCLVFGAAGLALRISELHQAVAWLLRKAGWR